jgi:tRNA pseudouridine32 synthase / 23S rRNA pseudouridine746 synthase
MALDNPLFFRFQPALQDAPPTPLDVHRAFEPAHPWALQASEELKDYLANQLTTGHNFGFASNQDGFVRGKMFGVLVVRNASNEVGYLRAFSGKLDGSNHHHGFVPPVFDGLTEGSFLNLGMQKLSRMSAQIKDMQATLRDNAPIPSALSELIDQRRKHSQALHEQWYDSFCFRNQKGDTRNLRMIFAHTEALNPPGGAGECAGPKLLQYAFSHALVPLALAEFYWGSPVSDHSCVHGSLYPPCSDKCAPILSFMLS